MTSRIPPVSPASIMLVVRSSKTTGYWRMALASVEPPSTVVRTPVRVFWKVWLSWLDARISRHCTSGSPASIMKENWRKKTAISLVLTFPEPKVGSENSLPFSRTEPGVIRSRRNCWSTTSLLAAVRSPEIFSPDALFPENVNTGMVVSPSLIRPVYLAAPHRSHEEAAHGSALAGLLLGRSSRLGHSGSASFVQQARAAIDHFLQFILVARPLQRHFQRDLFLDVGGGQRLIERLHAELFLPRLHSRINLVNLVLTNQVPDRGIGHHDFHAHRAALVVSLGQQALTHDAFEHE